MSGKPIQNTGYYDEDILGFQGGIIQNVTLPGLYSQMPQEKYIGTMPVAYPRGEKLAEGEESRFDPEEYAKEDNSAEDEKTYFERASDYMTGQSKSLLDYNNDGVLDSKDIKDMANDVKSGVGNAVKATGDAVEDKITDMGAEMIEKTSAYEEIQVKTDQALILLKEQSDSALVKVDELKENVDARLGQLGNNLALALGGIALAYIVFSRGD